MDMYRIMSSLNTGGKIIATVVKIWGICCCDRRPLQWRGGTQVPGWERGHWCVVINAQVPATHPCPSQGRGCCRVHYPSGGDAAVVVVLWEGIKEQGTPTRVPCLRWGFFLFIASPHGGLRCVRGG